MARRRTEISGDREGDDDSAEAADYYRLLDVARDADEETIRRAARAALKEYHPDRGGNAPGLQAVLRARDTLLDPSARRRYDAVLRGEAAAALPSSAGLKADSDRAAWALGQARRMWSASQRRGRVIRWTAAAGLAMATLAALYMAVFATIVAAPFFVLGVAINRAAHFFSSRSRS